MLCQYDFYDLYAVLTNIRSDIQYNYNTNILNALIDVIEYDGHMEDNLIRKTISAISGLDKEKWFFINHNNLYVYHKRINQSYVYDLLYSMCTSLREVLIDRNFEMAYDIVDCIHDFPLIMVEKDLRTFKNIFRNRVKFYRKRWDNNFLIKEEKILNS